ncbi:hypothetical protein KM043_000156 [Ampulex compressa]|nr:hypothetical protein KM043_000156 [Ampulex compressa]
MRCFKCQRFGHTANRCEREQLCICGKSLHEGNQCVVPITCINCKGNHTSKSKACPRYKEEFKIQKIISLNKVSYQEARRSVSNENNRPISYAQITAANSQPQKPIDTKALIEELLPQLSSLLSSHLQQQIQKFKLNEAAEQIKEQHTTQIVSRTSDNIDVGNTRNINQKQLRKTTSSNKAGNISKLRQSEVCSKVTLKTLGIKTAEKRTATEYEETDIDMDTEPLQSKHALKNTKSTAPKSDEPLHRTSDKGSAEANEYSSDNSLIFSPVHQKSARKKKS